MTDHIVEDHPGSAYRKGKKEVHQLPKNLVLYGPPGTGKTYLAIRYAVAIVENRSKDHLEKESQEQILRRFQRYRESRQIEFVTFHQSFTYEDFVQGLKPNTQAGTLLFEKKDGVFKMIADRARKNLEWFDKQLNKPKIPFEDLINLFLSKNINPDTEEIELFLDKSQRMYQSIVIFDILEDGLLYRRKTKNNHLKKEERQLSFKKMALLYQGKNIRDSINEKYYKAVIDALKNYEESLAEDDTEIELQNFVIILDEINRANIAAVFGELITLIEEDKRYGAKNGLLLSLSSGDTFGVPVNLYLIGTMNTADKSIATIDLELRRRFVFEAIYPDEAQISNEKIRKIVKSLNQAIYKEKKSADFLIGQTYFLGLNEAGFLDVMNRQILPMLSEYFFHRREQLIKLLKENGLKVSEQNYQLQVSF